MMDAASTRTPALLRACGLALLLCAAGRLAREPQVISLASAEWTRNGVPVDGLAREHLTKSAQEPGAPPLRVRLPVDGRGVRWATVFSTVAAGTHRLQLDWEPGPEGMLFEILLDGERVSPARDAWRPSRRHLRTDLGPRWLGAGAHLIEFIAREEVSQGELVLRSLDLRAPGG